MSEKYFILCFIACCWLLKSQGQTTGNELLHFQLDTVTVKGKYQSRPEEANIGIRVSTLKAGVLESNRTKSLSELLSDNTLVYIKSFGQGALATSSFRGTAPNHTQVNWNGININPSMSSSFDFSQVPVFFTDQVSLYHGSGFLKNGTGALGGSINIGNAPDWNDRTFLRILGEYGSYNTYTAAADVRFLRKSALYRTRLYYQSSDNDYRYLNKLLKKDPFYENRKEARYKQAGFVQEAYSRFSGQGTLSSVLWLQYGERHLPQPIIVNVTQHEKQKDVSLKYFLGYEHKKTKHEYSVKGAYILDYLDYRQWSDNEHFPGQNSDNTANALSIRGNYSYKPSSKFSAGLAFMYNYDFIRASSYSKKRVDRNVVSLQGNLLWQPFTRFAVNGQIMEEGNAGDYATTFSVGASWDILPNRIQLKGNVAYNYRFPSLNDLYWQPGGNPELLPEKGFSYDLTLTCSPRISPSVFLKAEATYYRMDIEDWIMWLPTERWYWRPVNVQNVLSQGFELLTESTFLIGDFTGRIHINYSYSPSVNKEKRFEEDATYKKQLPYIPKNKANFRFSGDYKKLFFSYQICYTGVRYTTNDESYSTNAYWIHDAEIGYRFSIKNRFRLTPKIKANNLLNTYYESTQYYPMPLRNISGSVIFTF